MTAIDIIQRDIDAMDRAIAFHADMIKQLTGTPDPNHIARMTAPHLRKGLAKDHKHMQLENEARLADLRVVMDALRK